mmetsp:Transcript_16163/g.37350  ORF Transcript_16163/g.37350 Transcript_16163/m.37350 type:complete len:392 (+) Transcript_16163:307-1482(+)
MTSPKKPQGLRARRKPTIVTGTRIFAVVLFLFGAANVFFYGSTTHQQSGTRTTPEPSPPPAPASNSAGAGEALATPKAQPQDKREEAVAAVAAIEVADQPEHGVCRASSNELVCAHRASGEQHSLEAMPGLLSVKTHLKKGVMCFDLDVVMSKDGELFVGHDDHISRALPGLAAHEATAAQLKKRAGAASLEDILDIFSEWETFIPTRAITLEPKGKVADSMDELKKLTKAVSKSKVGRAGKVALIVHNTADARTLKLSSELSEIPLAVPVKDRRTGDEKKHELDAYLQALCKQEPIDAQTEARGKEVWKLYSLVMPSTLKVCAALVEQSHKHGLLVAVWPIESLHDIETMNQRLGVQRTDRIITNSPKCQKRGGECAVLARRGFLVCVIA